MDLNLIITHIDNFVDTWKGWNSVFEGIIELSSFDFFDELGDNTDALSGGFKDLSSK
ncbi:hypothetical protein [Corynebacterium sp.]|uniref:hypothetical protein n=1 Tax=Corynebacterium sp. TaxID=1720 RepID=UPI002A91B5CB|nr:hypothetical protein [Corynebacterium sp.]MDY5785578.1 hypothetical protein [Corynebacterium sp.]